MANYYEPTEEQLREWAEWLAARPEHVRRVAERFAPWKLYRRENQRVIILSFHEHANGGVSVRMGVLAKWNELLSHERAVFGIDPDELEECELPDPATILGEPLFTTVEEVKAFHALAPERKEEKVRERVALIRARRQRSAN